MYQLPEIPVKRKSKAPYRKPEAVKLLERIATEDAQRRHPSIDPAHLAPRRFRDDTANGLTACIVAYARLTGAFTSRLNNTGIYRNGRYTYGTSRRGLPDVLITRDGVSIFVEVKVKRDRMSDDQRRVSDEQRQAGGIYYVARSFEDFKEFYDSN